MSTTHRTAAAIRAEIASIHAADRAYNRTINEGGEGCERNSVSLALHDELQAAEDAEFAAIWTADVLAARRAAWNAGLQQIVNKHGRNVPQAAVSDLQRRLGYGVGEIARAKRLHGIA